MNISLRPHMLAAALALASAASAPALAQGHAHGASMSTAPAPSSSGTMSEGEVRKVDSENKKITLKHGPLQNLDMPAMTMVFQVTDVSMLAKVKVGDKVRFVAANPGGKLTLSHLEFAN